MTFGQEIEYVRKMRSFSVVDMCNALGLTESQYMRLIRGKHKLTIEQKIMLIVATQYPFDSM